MAVSRAGAGAGAGVRGRVGASSSRVGGSRGVRGGAPRDRVVEIQRSRLLAAALGAVEDLGYTRVTVAHIASRARVSRRTFYELFENREDCLLAALESVVGMVREELAGEGLDEGSWRERVRVGLWGVLSFFEREPVLARVCVVQALRGGPKVLECREGVLAELARVVDEGRQEGAGSGGGCPPLTAEGLVGAAFTIVYGRLLRGEREPLTDLFGELMSMIVLPYLGPAAARREQARPLPGPARDGSPRQQRALVVRVGGATDRGGGGSDLLAGVPMRLTYRTTLVLEAIAEQPGVSNRIVGELADVSDQGQISKLLARLERLGLIENTGAGHARGERNAWRLTTTGRRVAHGIRARTPTPDHGDAP
jgi:AcrR family transcriptional regulator